METTNLTNKPGETRSARFISGANQILPVVALIWAIAGSVFGYYLFNRDVQSVSAENIRNLQTEQKNIRSVIDERRVERDKQFDNLEKKMLTREVFEAFHRSDQARMDRIESLINKIFENQIK